MIASSERREREGFGGGVGEEDFLGGEQSFFVEKKSGGD